MNKTLFIFELHGSTDVAEFFRINTPLLHEKGYRNIGYELNQKEAERVLDPTQKLIGPGGKLSVRQKINDLFMNKNPQGKITGLDVPELNDLNRFILNIYLSDHFEKIHCVRDHHIFHQARKPSEKSQHGSVNLVGCNHVGIMHQLIAYAVRENQLDYLNHCKFVFLVETGYPKPTHLFGTTLPAYPLDALFIDTFQGLTDSDKKLKEYLERPVIIPEAALLSKIQQEVDAITLQQTQYYNSYCTRLFQVYNTSVNHGIQIQTIMFAQEPFRPLITELAKRTFEAVNNHGVITHPIAKISKSAIAVSKEVGFKFLSLKEEAMEAYRLKQFERAETLFENCLNESRDPLESISFKYNLASACRESNNIEKALKLFHEVIVTFYEIHQKDLSKEAETLSKYLSRYFDLLTAHPSLYTLFESETNALVDIHQSAHLEDKKLSATIESLIDCHKSRTLFL